MINIKLKETSRSLLKAVVRNLCKKYFCMHKPRSNPIFIFAMPRGGSTWLMEIISSQKGFRYISEPFQLKNYLVQKYLQINCWNDLYMRTNDDVIIQYLKNIESNHLTFKNPIPGSRFWRPYTYQTVFKVINGCEDRLDYIVNTLNGHTIILLRHPIAVSVSRKVLPRLNAYVKSDYADFFTEKQIHFAHQIISKGSYLAKAVLSWCFQASVPLRNINDNVHVLTYEQMVLEPDKVIYYLNNWLGLKEISKLRRQFNVPSRTANLSFEKSSKYIKNQDVQTIVRKWSDKVDKNQERNLLKILDVFEIDAYRQGEFTSSKYWLYPFAKKV